MCQGGQTDIKHPKKPKFNVYLVDVCKTYGGSRAIFRIDRRIRVWLYPNGKGNGIFGNGGRVVALFGFGDTGSRVFPFEMTSDFPYTVAFNKWIAEVVTA